MAVEENVRYAWLMDFYGGLLTEQQRRVLELHLDQDWSLAEIGEALGISRQGVSDCLKRGKNQLSQLEERLGLLKRHLWMADQLKGLRAEVAAGQTGPDTAKKLDQLIEEWEERDGL